MKETTARKEPNPGNEYIRIYLPLDVQQKLDHVAHDGNVSRGKLITRIIEQYVNKPHGEGIGSANVTINKRKRRLKEVQITKKRINQTEKRVKTVFTEPQVTETKRETPVEAESRDRKTAAPDLDIIAFGRAAPLTTRTKTVLDIVYELEREEGEASIDKIMERSTKAGFNKDEVRKEIDRLTQTMEIYETIRGSGNYLTAVRLKRTG